MKLNKHKLEIAFISIIFTILAFSIAGNISLRKLNHEYPAVFYASDAFWSVVYIEHQIDTSSYKYRPSYVSLGYNNVVSTLPPLLFVIPAFLSDTSGISSYDSLLFMINLLYILLPFSIYLLIRKLNTKIAILSLIFTAFMISKTSMIALYLSQYSTIFGVFMLVSLVYFIDDLKGKNKIISLTLLASALMLVHPPEFIYFVGILIVFIAYKFFRKELDMNYWKNLIISGLATAIITSYYAIIFLFTHVSQEAGEYFQLFQKVDLPYFSFPSLIEYGFFLILIIAGLLISILYLIKKKANVSSILFGLCMLGISYSNLIGVYYRPFQQRFFFPIYLAVFFAIAAYHIIQFIKPNFLVYIIISLISFSIVIAINYEPIKAEGLMSKDHWDAFMWLKNNIGEDKKTLFFYGDSYDQDAQFGLIKRQISLMKLPHYNEVIQEGKIARNIPLKAIQNADTYLPYRTSLFKFERYLTDEVLEKLIERKDMCQFDFYAIDKVGSIRELIAYDMILRNELLKNEYIKEVYSNPTVSILMNEKPGNECINEISLTQ